MGRRYPERRTHQTDAAPRCKALGGVAISAQARGMIDVSIVYVGAEPGSAAGLPDGDWLRRLHVKIL